MSGSVEELQAELVSIKEKEKEKRKKLTDNLRLVRDKLQLVVQLKERADRDVQQEREQREQLQKSEQGLKTALAAEQQRCAAMQQALEASQREAAAAAAATRAAQDTATTARKTADAARAEAAAAAKQLAAVQAQLQRLEAQCRALQQAVAAPPELGAASAEMQREVQLLHGQQAGILAEMQRWRAALAPLAALASSPGLGGDAPLAPPAARAPPAPAAAAVATSPRKRQTKQQRRAATQADPGTRAAPAAGSAAPPETDAEVRARAVAMMQAAAGSKRPREPTLPAMAGDLSGFNEALHIVAGSIPPASKRRQPAADAAAPPGHPCGQPATAPAAAATAVGAEASLAISANGLAEGQQREEATTADEVARLLGRITAAAAPGRLDGTDHVTPSVQLVHSVAADLLRLLAEGRAPLPLLLACFETAVLECAAPKPQVQYMQYAQQGGPQQAQHEATTSAIGAAASPDVCWFVAAAGGPDAAEPPFAALWASRGALAGHCLHWLLLCTMRMHEMQRRHAELTAAAASHAPHHSQPVLPALRQHLHRLVVGSCLAAAQRCGGHTVTVTGGHSGAVRHTETEACALAAAAAGLCRASGCAEACWALLLDLACCAAAPSVLLPPLAAALDVWPALLDPPPPSRAAAAASEALPLATFHSALKHLCSLAEAGGEEPGEDGGWPPVLLLDRQPAAAALFVRRLGRRRWGWSKAAAGSAEALLQLKAALDLPPGQLPRQDQDMAPAQVIAQHAEVEPSPPMCAAAAELPSPGGDAGMIDVHAEEI